MHRTHILALLLSVCLGIVFFFVIVTPKFPLPSAFSIGEISKKLHFEAHEETRDEKILVVGDIMLARDVERKLDEFGIGYPHQYMRDVYDAHTFILGNFESSVPKMHVSTPSMQYTFSARNEHVKSLTDVGFTHVSLANNHSFDFGSKGYFETMNTMADVGLIPFGSAYAVGSTSITYQEVDAVEIAFVGIDYTLTQPGADEVNALFVEASKNSEVQIAYLHWGNEYQLVHSAMQEKLARTLIESGADLIIGNHPHVVQDIQILDGVLIFYSLGNFIFDQWFSKDVQEGLVLSIDPSGRGIALIPVSTHGSRIAPRVMPEIEKTIFLDALAKKSHVSLSEAISEGNLAY